MNDENIWPSSVQGSNSNRNLPNDSSPVGNLSKQFKILNIGDGDDSQNKKNNFLMSPLKSIENVNPRTENLESDILGDDFSPILMNGENRGADCDIFDSVSNVAKNNLNPNSAKCFSQPGFEPWTNPFDNFFGVKSAFLLNNESSSTAEITESASQNVTHLEETAGKLVLKIATPYKTQTVPLRGLDSEETDFEKKRDILMQSDKKLYKSNELEGKVKKGRSLMASMDDAFKSMETDSTHKKSTIDYSLQTDEDKNIAMAAADIEETCFTFGEETVSKSSTFSMNKILDTNNTNLWDLDDDFKYIPDSIEKAFEMPAKRIRAEPSGNKEKSAEKKTKKIRPHRRSSFVAPVDTSGKKHVAFASFVDIIDRSAESEGELNREENDLNLTPELIGVPVEEAQNVESKDCQTFSKHDITVQNPSADARIGMSTWRSESVEHDNSVMDSDAEDFFSLDSTNIETEEDVFDFNHTIPTPLLLRTQLLKLENASLNNSCASPISSVLQMNSNVSSPLELGNNTVVAEISEDDLSDADDFKSVRSSLSVEEYVEMEMHSDCSTIFDSTFDENLASVQTSNLCDKILSSGEQFKLAEVEIIEMKKEGFRVASNVEFEANPKVSEFRETQMENFNITPSRSPNFTSEITSGGELMNLTDQICKVEDKTSQVGFHCREKEDFPNSFLTREDQNSHVALSPILEMSELVNEPEKRKVSVVARETCEKYVEKETYEAHFMDVEENDTESFANASLMNATAVFMNCVNQNQTSPIEFLHLSSASNISDSHILQHENDETGPVSISADVKIDESINDLQNNSSRIDTNDDSIDEIESNKSCNKIIDDDGLDLFYVDNKRAEFRISDESTTGQKYEFMNDLNKDETPEIIPNVSIGIASNELDESQLFNIRMDVETVSNDFQNVSSLSKDINETGLIETRYSTLDDDNSESLFMKASSSNRTSETFFDTSKEVRENEVHETQLVDSLENIPIDTLLNLTSFPLEIVHQISPNEMRRTEYDRNESGFSEVFDNPHPNSFTTSPTNTEEEEEEEVVNILISEKTFNYLNDNEAETSAMVQCSCGEIGSDDNPMKNTNSMNSNIVDETFEIDFSPKISEENDLGMKNNSIRDDETRVNHIPSNEEISQFINDFKNEMTSGRVLDILAETAGDVNRSWLMNVEENNSEAILEDPLMNRSNLRTEIVNQISPMLTFVDKNESDTSDMVASNIERKFNDMSIYGETPTFENEMNGTDFTTVIENDVRNECQRITLEECDPEISVHDVSNVSNKSDNKSFQIVSQYSESPLKKSNSDSTEMIVDETRAAEVPTRAEILESVDHSKQGEILEPISDYESDHNETNEIRFIDVEELNPGTVANECSVNVTRVISEINDQTLPTEDENELDFFDSVQMKLEEDAIDVLSDDRTKTDDLESLVTDPETGEDVIDEEQKINVEKCDSGIITHIDSINGGSVCQPLRNDELGLNEEKQNEIMEMQIDDVPTTKITENINYFKRKETCETFTNSCERINEKDEPHLEDIEEMNLSVLAGNGPMNVTTVITGIVDRSLPIEPRHSMVKDNDSEFFRKTPIKVEKGVVDKPLNDLTFNFVSEVDDIASSTCRSIADEARQIVAEKIRDCSNSMDDTNVELTASLTDTFNGIANDTCEIAPCYSSLQKNDSDSREIVQNEVNVTCIMDAPINTVMLESVNSSEEGKLSETSTGVREESFLNEGYKTRVSDVKELDSDVVVNDSLMSITTVFAGIIDQSSPIEPSHPTNEFKSEPSSNVQIKTAEKVINILTDDETFNFESKVVETELLVPTSETIESIDHEEPNIYTEECDHEIIPDNGSPNITTIVNETCLIASHHSAEEIQNEINETWTIGGPTNSRTLESEEKTSQTLSVTSEEIVMHEADEISPMDVVEELNSDIDDKAVSGRKTSDSPGGLTLVNEIQVIDKPKEDEVFAASFHTTIEADIEANVNESASCVMNANDETTVGFQPIGHKTSLLEATTPLSYRSDHLASATSISPGSKFAKAAKIRENLDKLLTPFRQNLDRLRMPMDVSCSNDLTLVNNVAPMPLFVFEECKDSDKTRFVVEMPANLLDISVSALDDLLSEPQSSHDNLSTYDMLSNVTSNVSHPAKEDQNLKKLMIQSEDDKKKITELIEMNEKLLSICTTLSTNEAELKKVFHEAEDNLRIQMNKYEMMKDYTNRYICEMNNEFETLEAELKLSKEKCENLELELKSSKERCKYLEIESKSSKEKFDNLGTLKSEVLKRKL